mmetsp:Transcript_23347/g.55357  ORF Transcript_23347/g.55357 Transcript_23347/m.55357 type:complete len:210 (+) Transcript_23347:711-1340(+)
MPRSASRERCRRPLKRSPTGPRAAGAGAIQARAKGSLSSGLRSSSWGSGMVGIVVMASTSGRHGMRRSVAQRLAQRDQRAADLRLDRAEGKMGLARDLLVREAVEEGQRDKLAWLGLEQQQGAVQRGMPLGHRQQLIAGLRRWRGQRRGDVVGILVERLMLVARLAADRVDGPRARHAEQPGQRAAPRGVEAWRLAPDLEIHLLGHLLG